LIGHDKQILAVLAEHGPSTTGEIVSHLEMEKTAMAVRERCWLLMGLDEIVADRETQLVDQDSETGEWGLADHIATSERGRIPDDPRELLKRAEDERVRQMRSRGYDREEVADIIGVTERTIRQKERRAKAYQFPLDVVAGSEARADYRDRRGDSCHEEDTGDGSPGTDHADISAERMKRESEIDATAQDIATDDEATPLAESGEMWPAVGSLARFPGTDEYVFVLNVSSTHDRLQGIRTTCLSEETCAQIAAAGEPSQSERLADAVRLMAEGPHCSGDAQAYEPVPLETVVNPEMLMEESTGRQ
jgi:transcriptional regulator with XRE-family HTH domain